MRAIWCGLAVLIGSFHAMAQPSRGPVPRDLLRENALVIPQANLSIPAPDNDWHWEVVQTTSAPQDAIGTFVCINSRRGIYYVVNLPGGEITHLTEDAVRGALDAVRDSSPEAAASLRHNVSDIPLPGSLRYSYSHTYPNIGRQNTYAYTAATGTYVNFMTITSQEREPPEFTAFVESLRMLKPLPTRAPAAHAGSSMVGYFAILLITAGIAGSVNRTRKRIVVNPFKVAAWVVALTFVAELCFAIVLINVKNIHDPSWQIRLVGDAFAGAIFPLIVGIVLARYGVSQGEEPRDAAA